MERREAVKYISILLGGAVVGANSFLTGCKSNTGSTMAWDEKEIAYLDEIGETILPQTNTPGAKAAKVGEFMKVMVNDCYEQAHQTAFREGMTKLNDESKKKFSSEFMAITPEQRKELLIALDKDAKEHQKKVNDFNQKENEKEKEEKAKGNAKFVKNTMAPHYFIMMKQLTLLGYFTSEIGAKQALRYNPAPGKYDGCLPYKKGDRAWS